MASKKTDLVNRVQDNFLFTPDVAKSLLENNIGNRALSQRHVSRLANCMRRGTFVSVNDAIVIGAGGRIINGQHRLHAVIASGIEVRMLLKVDSALESARGVPCDLNRTRLGHFVYGYQKRVWSAASRVATFVAHRGSKDSCDFDSIEAVASVLQDSVQQLTTTTGKGLSKGARQGAVACCMLLRPQRSAEIADQYSMFLAAAHSEMWPAVEALERQAIGQLIARVQEDPNEMLARTFRAFNYGLIGKCVNKLQVSNLAALKESVWSEIAPLFASGVKPC